MAGKENAAPSAAAAGPRLTRAAAKRAAESAAAAPAPAKRKRVALGELPALAANAAVPRAQPPPRPVKPARPGAVEGRRLAAAAAEAERCGSSSPPRAAGAIDPDRDSSASTSPPRAAAIAAEADPGSSASSSPPRAAEAAAPGGDPQLCGSYASDIYTYLRALEVEPRRRPRSDYIEAVQSDVTANMRTILVDWLVEVAEEYKLVADTLYLAISYVDRFLSANVLSRDKLQLLGVAAMLIAAKYEEISPPHAEDFCYITDNTYTKQELVKMESDILKLLEFELGNPTIKTFLRRFTRSAHEDKKRSILLMEFLGSYLAELSLLDYGCLRFLPSVVAASVMFVARLTIDPNANPWNKKLQKVTGYKVSELKDCIVAIHDLQLNRKCSSLMAIRDKYKQHKFKFVSTLLPPVVIPASYFEDLVELSL
ncbi:Cyclin-A3-2 [Dichanthelium oligosanthes]|uniref:Cyclin-A3-2 n=1 Tax=Dichanthelium oligosanthes TaxID=888268 RepID=A0A1E5WFS5_9POAL|nr:Cyclin-A3-2 [Dichanthelium oligosanthes]